MSWPVEWCVKTKVPPLQFCDPQDCYKIQYLMLLSKDFTSIVLVAKELKVAELQNDFCKLQLMLF